MGHAFLWEQGTGMQDPGTLRGFGGFFSVASAINARGQVVGWCSGTFISPPRRYYPRLPVGTHWRADNGARRAMIADAEGHTSVMVASRVGPRAAGTATFDIKGRSHVAHWDLRQH